MGYGFELLIVFRLISSAMKNESGNYQDNLLSSSLDPFNEGCPSANAADVLCGRGRTSFNHGTHYSSGMMYSQLH